MENFIKLNYTNLNDLKQNCYKLDNTKLYSLINFNSICHFSIIDDEIKIKQVIGDELKEGLEYMLINIES